MIAAASRARVDRPMVALAASGAIGLAVGAFGHREWQVAVETSQVLAGLVTYPDGNPFFVYHVKLWTILHQACAAALAAGASERTISTALSGAVGMVTFQALAMAAFALSRDAIVAVVSSIAVVVSGAATFGVIYPIFLTGTTHTYGVVGLSAGLLAVGLVGSGCWRSGLFLLGLLPAIHPSIAAWVLLVSAIAASWGRRDIPEEARRAWWAFAAGAAISAASLAAHVLLAPPVPAIPASEAARYLAAFTRRWDGHRQPVPLDRPGVIVNAFAAIVAAAWLIRNGGGTAATAGPRWLLRFVVVCGAIGAGCIAVSRLPPDSLPASLVILMPGRLLNVNAMVFPALLAGLAGGFAERPWGAALTGLLAAGLVTTEESLLWSWLPRHGIAPRPLLPALTVLSLGTIVAVAVALVTRQPDTPRRSWRGAADAALVGLALPVVWAAALPLPSRDARAAELRDRTNEGVFAAASRGQGLLLTGGDLHLIQLRTRRPVLLDGGGLDALPYALESGPEMGRILREVYGIDLFDPPPEAWRSGAVPPGANRAVWERYSVERWREIRRTFRVTNVLTPGGWQLQLPVVAQNMSMLLYEIPE